ncbi:MAG: OmpA family protein [Sulfuricellaceae bacterium]|nr:OmpA family protein [Sulfuricellaceae bacterium]
MMRASRKFNARLRPLVLAVLSATLSLQTEAALDEVQVRMLRPYALPLRWDNVEHSPQWVKGAKPVYQRDPGLHSVRLEPGASIILRVPSGEQVRVWRADGTLAAADLDMDFSLGSGLYQRLPVALSDNRHDMLSRMRSSVSYLARISRPRQSASALEVALFISRHEPLGELAPYREVIALSGDSVQMRRADEAAAQTYWKFVPRQPIEARVKGPARYALENRLAYPVNESGLVQTYRVHAWIDDHPLPDVAFETSVESAYPVLVDGQMRVMGRSEVGYLEIPPGEHLLRLDSTAPLAARLLLQEQTDYLFPALNEPKLTAQQAREQEVPFRLALSGQLGQPIPNWHGEATPVSLSPNSLPEGERDAGSLREAHVKDQKIQPATPLQLRMSTWLASAPELARAVQDRTLTPTEQEAAALRLVRDNSRREGGLLGAMLMQDSAQWNPDYPAVQTVANELLGYHTFYRDVLPQENLTAEGQYFARFIPRDLHSLGEQGRGIVAGEQHLQALLDRIPGGYFTEVPLKTERAPIDSQPEGASLKLTLPADVLFDTDKAALKPRYQNLLEEAVALIRSRSPLRVQVIGHTDSHASDAYNQQLSERRAQAVAGFLARSGISPAILHALGKGERHPLASNDSASGRQLNRRVEIRLEGVAPQHSIERVKPGYHRYMLPTRVEPSLLRVVVDAPEAVEAEFFLQFDAAKPMRMHALAGQELPDSEYAPAQGDAALEILAQQFGPALAATSAGPFAARRVPGRLAHARLMEIPLPSSVREVRVWRSAPDAPPLHVALQYRAAKPFALSEGEYLEMAARTGDSSQALAAFIRTLQTATANEIQNSAQEQGNHWLPLVRAMRSQHKVFSTPVGMLQAPPSGASALNAAQQARLQSEALAAGGEGRWLSALESWAELARHAPLPLREEAMLAQTEALLQLGENYLAEQQLRSLALTAGEDDVRRRASERLDAYYREAGETDSQVSLWSAMSVQQLNPLHLRRLSESLADNSEHELAMAVGLPLPPAEQPREHLLRSAYQLGWWTVYQQLALSETSTEQQSLRQGLAAMSQGRTEVARQYFDAGGSQGQVWLAALDSGNALAQRFHLSPQLDNDDVDAWLRWHSGHPGPFVWREEAHLVTDFAGSETLYSIDRDAYSRAYLATADKPVRLRLMGPVRLRIEARPVHADSASEAVDGWLRMKESSGMRLLPISNNLPVSGLELAGRSDLKAGRKVSGEFDFGPGIHELELDAGRLPVLLRVLARRPEMVVPLAPPLQTDGLNRSNLALSRQEPALPPGGERLSGMAWPEAASLAAGDVVAALAMHPGQNERDALRRMTLLLWWSEQNPAMRERALVEAEALGARYPAHAGLQSLLSRLSRDVMWQAAVGIQDSAGQRYIEIAGWQPESPSLRARKALMSSIGAADQMVSSNGRLLFTLRNLRPATVELHLSQEELALFAPLPLKAFYQLDGAASVAVPLSADKPTQKISLNIPAGDHVLRVGITNPLADQFLRARMVERGPSVPMSAIERPWHVATRKEPLRLAVAGPAWLRIDEWRDGKVESRYQQVAADFEELLLAPSGQRTEALFRVHQRVMAAGVAPVLPRVVDVTPEPAPQAYARVEVAEPARQVSLQDDFQLGGQEDGSWGYTAQLARRRDPEGEESTPAEDFLQLSATHRYYDENQRTYYRSEMLGRLREAGGPTLALLESIEHRPAWTTLNFMLDAGLYLQNPDGGLMGGENEWSAFLKGSVKQKRALDPKTWHVPRATLFVYNFSMDSIGNYVPSSVDQDIFTSYKSTHRHGLQVADTLYHRPWLDTVWHAGAALKTNENFSIAHPDYLGFKAGWQQLLGNLQLDASYGVHHYFADDQRAQASNQRTWLLDAAWNQWNSQQNRLEAGFQLRHDSDTKETTGMLYFSWHDSKGRRYRDFRPDEVDFRDLRTRDIPSEPNNIVKGIQDD